VQRVARARVSVAGASVAEIGPGLLVLLGVTHSDDIACAERLRQGSERLRIFADTEGKMNEPLGDREVCCVSQFTLYGDAQRGTRPSFAAAAEPGLARTLFEHFCDELGALRGSSARRCR